jgi:hypothetical protein
MTRVVVCLVLLVGCGSDAPPPAPEPPTTVLSPEVQAHRDAELREWLAVDELMGHCYEPYRAAHPNTVGAVAVRFTILPDGHAQHVVITAADPHDEEAEACIVRAVEAMPFTPSAEPVERTIERQFDEG